MICLLTEHGIVLSQAEQFDVLDLYKTCTQDIKTEAYQTYAEVFHYTVFGTNLYYRLSHFGLIDEKEKISRN